MQYGRYAGSRLAEELDAPASPERRLRWPVQWVVKFRHRRERTWLIRQPTVKALSWQDARRKAAAMSKFAPGDYQALGEECLADTWDNPTVEYTPSAEELAELEPWLRREKA